MVSIWNTSIALIATVLMLCGFTSKGQIKIFPILAGSSGGASKSIAQAEAQTMRFFLWNEKFVSVYFFFSLFLFHSNTRISINPYCIPQRFCRLKIRGKLHAK